MNAKICRECLDLPTFRNNGARYCAEGKCQVCGGVARWELLRPDESTPPHTFKICMPGSDEARGV